MPNIPGKSYNPKGHGTKSYTRPTTLEEEEAAIERANAAYNKRVTTDYRKRSKQEAIDDRFEQIKKKTAEMDLQVNLCFIDINEINVNETSGILNQIMVMYRNGELETLPKRINGLQVREYLGFKFSRITHWCMLPTPSSTNNHFKEFKDNGSDRKKFGTKAKDVFGDN